MSQLTLILGSGPLSEAARPPGWSADADDLKRWVLEQIQAGHTVCVPEIADYEVRRELTRTGKTDSIARLDTLLAALIYLPITTAAMRVAAGLWADARNKGWATADPKALDGDVILAAQALTFSSQPPGLIVVTENVAHLSRYVTARTWETILQG